MYFQPQSKREPRIRLFRSDWLEALTTIHPAVVVVVWTPIIGWFLVTPLLFVIGLGAATFGLLRWMPRPTAPLEPATAAPILAGEAR